MNWLGTFLTSSIGRKVVVAIAGLFLCLFLVIHLSGNLGLMDMSPEGQIHFNEYTAFMTSNPLIKMASYVTYAAILLHAIMGIMVSYRNRQARGVHYYKSKPSNTWMSRSMAILGILTLLFIVVHMGNFWFKYKFGEIPTDPEGHKDMARVVIASFSELWYTGLYVVLMFALMFHLYHGFASGFQTLGLNHKKYTPIIRILGIVFAIIVPLAFAIIPIYVYLATQNII